MSIKTFGQRDDEHPWPVGQMASLAMIIEVMALGPPHVPTVVDVDVVHLFGSCTPDSPASVK